MNNQQKQLNEIFEGSQPATAQDKIVNAILDLSQPLTEKTLVDFFDFINLENIKALKDSGQDSRSQSECKPMLCKELCDLWQVLHQERQQADRRGLEIARISQNKAPVLYKPLRTGQFCEIRPITSPNKPIIASNLLARI